MTRLRSLLVLALALCLSGCLASRTPLFDATSSVFPIPANSQYRHFQRFQDGGDGVHFQEIGDVTITVENGQYHVARAKKHRGQMSETFTLHDLGGEGLYAVQSFVSSERGEAYVYDLIQIGPDGRILSWEIDCTFDLKDDEAQVLGINQSTLPVCFVDDVATLKAAFTRIRALRPHTSEYAPLGVPQGQPELVWPSN